MGRLTTPSKSPVLAAPRVIDGPRLILKTCLTRRDSPFRPAESVWVDLRRSTRGGGLNGVPGLRIIDREELSRLEPNVVSAEALFSPTGSIVDSRGLVFSIAREAEERGAELIMGVKVVSLQVASPRVRVSTTAGD